MKQLLVTFFLMCCTTTASASIIYDVNRTIGAGTVVGFIETDGTLGALGSGAITDWSLTLTAPNLSGGSPDLITFATQSQTNLSGAGTTATLTELIFDFSVAGSFFLLQGSSPTNYWCLESLTASCTGGGIGEHMGFDDLAYLFTLERLLASREKIGLSTPEITSAEVFLRRLEGLIEDDMNRYLDGDTKRWTAARYDALRNEYQALWISPLNTGMNIIRGQGDPEREGITLGQAGSAHSVLRYIDSESFVIEQSGVDVVGREGVVQRTLYVRRPERD